MFYKISWIVKELAGQQPMESFHFVIASRVYCNSFCRVLIPKEQEVINFHACLLRSGDQSA